MPTSSVAGARPRSGDSGIQSVLAGACRTSLPPFVLRTTARWAARRSARSSPMNDG
jgi:hypothetical protein